MSQASDTPAELLDALHDEEPGLSIETVIASLGSRSNAERQALLEALQDGDKVKRDTHPVSGTTLNYRKKRLSRALSCLKLR